jgi:hypothetical protein
MAECTELTHIIDDRDFVESLLSNIETREQTEMCIPIALQNMLSFYNRSFTPTLPISQLIKYLRVLWRPAAGCSDKLAMAARQGLYYLVPLLLSPRSLERRTLSSNEERMLGLARPELCADINTKNGLPLRHAIAQGDVTMVSLLLNNRANPNLDGNMLQLAAYYNHNDVVRVLAPYMYTSKLNDALLTATRNGNLALVKMLISAGASPFYHRDVLYYNAVASGNADLIKYLHELGIVVFVNINKYGEYANIWRLC